MKHFLNLKTGLIGNHLRKKSYKLEYSRGVGILNVEKI